jgi:DNA-binding LytR/AlgR family response regulator
MVRFVIVEDEEENQICIKKAIRESIFANSEIKIDCFSKFTSDLKNIIKTKEERKIYIMDIELGGKINGIDIAKFIRENDWDSEIIFITSHDKMFETAYRSVYEIFDFIEKFHHMDTRLKNDLKVIYNKSYDNKMFKYNNKNVNIQLFYRSIKYLYRDTESRKLIIVTDNNDYSIYLNVSDSLNYLDSRFKMSHRACIINTSRVVKYNWTKGYFVLDDNQKVYMLSKKYRKDIEE